MCWSNIGPVARFSSQSPGGSVPGCAVGRSGTFYLPASFTLVGMSAHDELLLKRARAGDPDAFGALIRPELSSIRRFAMSFARDQVDADDLAQEALLKAFRSFRAYEERASLTNWLYAVTRSVCLDHFRSAHVRRQRGQVPLADDLQDEAPDPHEDAERRDRQQQLWAAIRDLEPIFRVPVVLFDIEGLSYEDVAAIEEVPVGTVRSRLSRARKRLRAALEGDADEPSTDGASGAQVP